MKTATIGILGGMGPLATADLFRKIILHTRADSDREHIPVIIDSNTAIPDRTEYLLGRGESPLDELVKTALRLEAMGADILLMPCNTAHFFYEEIRSRIGIDFINMIEETALQVKKEGGGKKSALLSTEGTSVSGIYDKVFAEMGLELIKPEKDEQDKVSEVIYNVKKGVLKGYEKSFKGLLASLKKRGAGSFILGCTELPVYFETLKADEKIFDPTDILAVRGVEKAGKQVI